MALGHVHKLVVRFLWRLVAMYPMLGSKMAVHLQGQGWTVRVIPTGMKFLLPNIGYIATNLKNFRGNERQACAHDPAPCSSTYWSIQCEMQWAPPLFLSSLFSEPRAPICPLSLPTKCLCQCLASFWLVKTSPLYIWTSSNQDLSKHHNKLKRSYLLWPTTRGGTTACLD